MARVYILNNVNIPSSAGFVPGNDDGSQYVVSDGFNSSNCKSTVTYYVTVDGNNYGSFTLDSNTVNWILDGLSPTSQYMEHAQLPKIGNLSLKEKDWDAYGAASEDDGWRWEGSSEALVSIYYEEDKQYFEDTKLNTIWNKLVSTVRTLLFEAFEGGPTWYIRYIPDSPGRCRAYISGGYVKVPADAYNVRAIDDETSESIPLSQENSIDLATLDTSKTYFIDHGTAGTGDATLVFGQIELDETGSIQDLQDKLIEALGLCRSTQATSIGDYLRGLSACANYTMNGKNAEDFVVSDTDTKYSLENIIDILQHRVTLSETGIAKCLCESADWNLYDAETKQWVHIDPGNSSPVDFSYYMEDGHPYYVVADNIVYNNDIVFIGNRTSPTTYFRLEYCDTCGCPLRDCVCSET